MPFCFGSFVELTPPQLSNEPGYRQIVVSLAGYDGNSEIKLSPGDLLLSQDGKQIPISIFRRQPRSIGILADTSERMEPKLTLMREAITEFVRGLDPKDKVFLLVFSDRPFLLQPPTTHHHLVLSRLVLLHAYGRPALYDSVCSGIAVVTRGRPGTNALFLMTDGIDNASKSSIPQLEGTLWKSDVAIYSIAIGNPGSERVKTQSAGLNASDQDGVNMAMLTKLADATHGKPYLIPNRGDFGLLRRDVSLITEKIGHRFVVGFVLTHGNSVRVELRNHKDLFLKIEDTPSDLSVTN